MALNHFLTRCLAVSALLLVFLAMPGVAGPIPPGDPTLPVTENGMTIGTIDMTANGGQLTGNFTATAIDPSTGKPYTLNALAKSLGEDHFNWLQDVSPSKDLTLTLYTYNADGTKITSTTDKKFAANTTIIDPQSGGQSGLWADNAPWYWDETVPPQDPSKYTPKLQGFYNPPQTELQAKTSGSTLSYGDTPGGLGLAGYTLTFTTFLVSIGPGNTYNPLAGFTWTDTIDATGAGTVTLQGTATDLTPTPFTSGINTEINTQGFGTWTLVPEPSTLILLTTGLVVIVPLGLNLRYQRKPVAVAA